MAENALPSSPLYTKAGDQDRARAEDFSTFYANNLSITFSTWEMALIFGEITGQKDGKPVVEEIAKVIMTREFAKVVSHLLALNLAGYEQRFGEITSPHFSLTGESAIVDFESLSRSPSASLSASQSPSTSASPSEGPPESDE